MTMTDLERNEALIHMVQSGAFPDDLALARWSVTAEAVPVLQRWLEAGRRSLPRAATDLDMEAVRAGLADEDALAADIQARFGAAAFPPIHRQTIMDMFGLGWFGQGLPFWRWIETPDAAPYIAACAAMRRAPQPGEFFDAFSRDDDAMSIIDDQDALAQLAARIEDEYGDIAPGATPASKAITTPCA